MNELQYIKKEYASRTKEGKQYRKEASKIQDAYSELRRLKRKHERQPTKRFIRKIYAMNVLLDGNRKYALCGYLHPSCSNTQLLRTNKWEVIIH